MSNLEQLLEDLWVELGVRFSFSILKTNTEWVYQIKHEEYKFCFTQPVLEDEYSLLKDLIKHTYTNYLHNPKEYDLWFGDEHE